LALEKRRSGKDGLLCLSLLSLLIQDQDPRPLSEPEASNIDTASVKFLK